MIDLLTAGALMMVMEGCLYALFPTRMKRAAMALLTQPEDRLRGVGLGLALLGVLTVWMIRR